MDRHRIDLNEENWKKSNFLQMIIWRNACDNVKCAWALISILDFFFFVIIIDCIGSLLWCPIFIVIFSSKSWIFFLAFPNTEFFNLNQEHFKWTQIYLECWPEIFHNFQVFDENSLIQSKFEIQNSWKYVVYLL